MCAQKTRGELINNLRGVANKPPLDWHVLRNYISYAFSFSRRPRISGPGVGGGGVDGRFQFRRFVCFEWLNSSRRLMKSDMMLVIEFNAETINYADYVMIVIILYRVYRRFCIGLIFLICAARSYRTTFLWV